MISTVKQETLFRLSKRICMSVLFVSATALASPSDDYDRGFAAYKADDLVTAMQHLERAAQAGHGEAQYLLGFILDHAEENEAAHGHYLQAAENGNANAAYALGVMYSSGDGVVRDQVRAVSWFERAVASGHGPASEKLGQAYLNGELGLAKDPEKGRSILQRAADAGYEPAQQLLQSLVEADG